MSFKAKLKSLTTLRRDHLEEIILSLTIRPYLMAIFNLFVIALVRLKRLVRRMVRRSPHIPEQVMDSMVQLHQPRSLPGRLHVLLIVEESIPHCFRYRVEQKLEQLKMCGYQANWVSWIDSARARQQIHFSHVVIFYRVPATEDVVGTIELAKALNKVVFYEIDDLAYDRKIMEENITKGFSRKLSKNECANLLAGTDLYKSAMRICPYTIGSTPALCEELARISNKVYLHRNGLDSRILEFVKNRSTKIKRDSVTIFYGSGTKTHDADFDLVASAMVRLLETFPEVRLTIVGFLELPKEFAPHTDRIDRIPFLSFESYWEFVRNADINIAPLQVGIFSDCKSEIKWLEAAMMKVPSIVSSTRTYREVLANGENAFIASSSRDWYEQLASLVEDMDLRMRMGENAYDFASAKYKPEDLARNLDEIIKDAVSREVERAAVRAVSRKKRIVYVNVLYPPYDLGGATVMVKNQIDVLQANYGSDFEVVVFTGNGTPGAAYEVTEYEHEGIHVTGVRVPLGADVNWRYQDQQIHDLFRQYVEFQQPDLIHFHCVQWLTASVLEVAQQCQVPYVVSLHDSWWLCDRQFMINNLDQDCGQFHVDPLICSGCVEDSDRSVKRRAYLMEQLGRANLLLAVSRYQQELYERNGFDNVVVNRNGISKNVKLRRKRSEGRVQMGYVGGICVHKGYHFLKEVVEDLDLNQSELTVVDFSLRSGKIRQEKWGSTPVRFISKVPFEDMPGFYQNLDVLIVPSLWRESFGLVVREALVHGVWIVAADTGALAEDIKHGINGHIFRKGSTEELATILREIDADPIVFRSREDADARKIRSVEKQVEELISIYDQVLDGS